MIFLIFEDNDMLLDDALNLQISIVELIIN